VVAAIRSQQQKVWVVIDPRRTAQHIAIFAPLPHIASHVVQPKLVGRKASHWTSPWIAVVIAFNDRQYKSEERPSGGPVPVLRLIPSIISGSCRRRPTFVPFLRDIPRIHLDLATLLFRGAPYLIFQPYRGAPFFVLRQPVSSLSVNASLASTWAGTEVDTTFTATTNAGYYRWHGSWRYRGTIRDGCIRFPFLTRITGGYGPGLATNMMDRVMVY
jgi:hypothetical protein